MVMLRSQDGVSKDKGIETEGSLEERMSRMEEMMADLQKSTLEAQKSNARQFSELMAAMNRSRDEKLCDDRSTLDRYSPSSQKVKGSGSEGLERSRGERRSDENQYRADGRQGHGLMTRIGKVEFPRFDGTNFKGWLFKAEQFFGVDYTSPDLKVKMASIHFDGFASEWHQNFIESDVGLSVLYDWRSYVQFLKEMFEDEDDDPMAELKKLQETEGIRDYHQKFETLRTRLKLPEDYLVSVYLAGLRTETHMHVKMFQPQTVRHAYFLGRTYEKAHPIKQSMATNWGSKGVSLVGSTRNLTEKVVEPVKATPKVSVHPTKRVSQQEMNERRSKGLCYLCDEKYTPEHYAEAHKKTLFRMDVEEEFEDAEEDLCAEEEPILDNVKPMPRISVNAVSGISDYCTMRVKGTFGKQTIYVLIDSGSTHNFLDTEVAAKLGCKVDRAELTQVSVADGRRLTVDGRIKGFQWNFQHTTFESDVLLIPLKGNDMVLGVQWLVTLGSIDWEFKKLEMGFKYKDKRVVLSGIKSGSVSDVKAQKLQKLQQGQIQLAMLCVHEVTEAEEEGKLCTLNALNASSDENSMVERMTSRFSEVFVEQTELPPLRNHHDHKIKLLKGSKPVHQRPHLPSVMSDVFVKGPEMILERQMVKRQGRAVTKVLVKWMNAPVEEATWEFLLDLQKKFPKSLLEP